MEDASLDDFFAKKDKSKKKSKIKSGDGDDLTKSSKKEKKKDKDKVNSTNTSTNKTQERKQPDDDEWNDFEEEKAVDYSGLRIQTLQQKEGVDKDGEEEEEELDENGELKERKDGTSGPWNKSATATAPVTAAENRRPEGKEEKPAPAPASTGKYIPPSQRAAAAAASSMPSSRRKKELPNVHSEFDFPTLATGPGQGQQQSNLGVQDNPNQRKGVNLSLENKFSCLQD